MTDDRSERLRQRRKQSTEDVPSPQSGDESTEDHETEARANGTGEEARDSAAEGSDAPDGESASVKNEQIGTYMYLPESQIKDIRRLYNILKANYEFEYDEKFEKNRHFYPLLVQYGLEELEGMDAAEIQTKLDDIR